MAKSLLLVCPSCERHVRTVDSSCPFCGLALSAEVRATLGLRPPARRLTTRAAFYALSVGTVSLTAACGGTVISDSEGGTQESGSQSDGESDTTCVCPPYGLAPPFDAETSSDAGEPDATQEDDGGPQEAAVLPPYGSPPPFDSGSK
jgi:hypothetical protein